MKSRLRENFVHGTPSLEDAENIQKEGFETKEGRATVSGDLIYAFEWATNQEKRKGSQSETEIDEEEQGRMIIMQVPDDKSVDYATHTAVDVNESGKEVTGYSSKFQSGRKQLAIYDEGDIIEKREKIEQAKKELKEINSQFSEFLKGNNINPDQIKSKKDLIEATKSFDVEKTIEILKTAGELESQRTEKRKEAEPGTRISPENILMSVVPTPEFGKKLNELQQKIKNLEKVDLEHFTEEVSEIIETNKENFLSSGSDIREIVGNLLSSTMKAEVVNMMRSLSMDVKIAQGYKIYNREKDEVKEKIIDKDQLRGKLESIQKIIGDEHFDMGIESLNRYIKISVDKMLKELNS